MKKLFSIFPILILAVILSSCGPSAVVVRERPPAPVYARPVAPSAGYIWVEPGYIKSGRGYAYRQGYWIQPRANKVYHQGYWRTTRRGYVWVPGRW